MLGYGVDQAQGVAAAIGEQAAARMAAAPRRMSEALRRLSRRAADLARQDKHKAAAQIWQELDELEPGHEAVLTGWAAALLGAGEVARAAHILGHAIARFPESGTLLHLHAQALLKRGDPKTAVGALLYACQLEPGTPAIRATLANALHQSRQTREALPHAIAGFDGDPNVSNAAVLAGILLDLGCNNDALTVVEAARAPGPVRVSKHVLRAMCLQMLDRLDESLAECRAAVAAGPAVQEARVALAMTLLLRGELTPEAWSHWDARAALVGVGDWPSPDRLWKGEPIPGKTLLIHVEQGLGDTIQFARYVPLLERWQARVIFAVQPPLLRLLQGIRGADLVVAAGGGELPPFDLYCPLMTLPGVLATTPDSVPPPVDLAVAAAPVRDGRLHVGLVWAGNPAFVDDRRRSLEPAQLQPLADLPGLAFYNLQFGAKQFPFPGIVDLMPGVSDFADTAARIAALDLVIAVDTSVAHLAASMGKPVWLLARKHGCWRWLLDRQDSPWYPSMRLYRQTRLGEWDDVVQRIRTDLCDLARRHAPQLAPEHEQEPALAL